MFRVISKYRNKKRTKKISREFTFFSSYLFVKYKINKFSFIYYYELIRFSEKMLKGYNFFMSNEINFKIHFY